MKRTLVIAMSLAALALGAASAYAGTRSTAHAQTVRKATLLKQVTVTATEFKFVLSAKSAGRGLVSFKVTNKGKIQHDFQINGRRTPLLNPGQSNTLRVTFLRKGSYPYICTVPGHAAAGMKGVFVIN
jgi:uncharacterized cupredoxin-like copper-binding protein